MRRELLILFGFPDGMSTSLGSPGKGEVKSRDNLFSKDFNRTEASSGAQVRTGKSLVNSRKIEFF